MDVLRDEEQEKQQKPPAGLIETAKARVLGAALTIFSCLGGVSVTTGYYEKASADPSIVFAVVFMVAVVILLAFDWEAY